jgi:uncharacterized membrane protein
VIHPLPTLFLIAGLCIRGPQRRLLGALAAFFALYLSVYVAVALLALPAAAHTAVDVDQLAGAD